MKENLMTAAGVKRPPSVLRAARLLAAIENCCHRVGASLDSPTHPARLDLISLRRELLALDPAVANVFIPAPDPTPPRTAGEILDYVGDAVEHYLHSSQSRDASAELLHRLGVLRGLHLDETRARGEGHP